jgi:hypothetical protein
MKPFTVYNILSITENKNISDCLRNSPSEGMKKLIENYHNKIEVEGFFSDDNKKCEIRLTFRDKSDHLNFIESNKEKYLKIVDESKNFWNNNNIKFERYTSDDYYISEFQGKCFLNFKNIIDYTLTEEQVNIFAEDVLFLGNRKDYNGSGQWDDQAPLLDGARFLKERHSNIRRFGSSPASYKDYNYPSKLIAYHFDHAIDCLMYKNTDMYKKIKKLCYDIEELTEKYISSCDYAAVIAGHNSLGKQFVVHSHRLNDENRKTFTVVVRLSKINTTPAKLLTWRPYDRNDPELPHYYVQYQRMQNFCKKHSPDIINLDSTSATLIFNATMSPHSVIWTNDLYLFFVYDHVIFKQGMEEKIKTDYDICLYQEFDQSDILYFKKY